MRLRVDYFLKVIDHCLHTTSEAVETDLMDLQVTVTSKTQHFLHVSQTQHQLVVRWHSLSSANVFYPTEVILHRSTIRFLPFSQATRTVFAHPDRLEDRHFWRSYQIDLPTSTMFFSSSEHSSGNGWVIVFHWDYQWIDELEMCNMLSDPVVLRGNFFPLHSGKVNNPSLVQYFR